MYHSALANKNFFFLKLFEIFIKLYDDSEQGAEWRFLVFGIFWNQIKILFEREVNLVDD